MVYALTWVKEPCMRQSLFGCVHPASHCCCASGNAVLRSCTDMVQGRDLPGGGQQTATRRHWERSNVALRRRMGGGMLFLSLFHAGSTHQDSCQHTYLTVAPLRPLAPRVASFPSQRHRWLFVNVLSAAAFPRANAAMCQLVALSLDVATGLLPLPGTRPRLHFSDRLGLSGKAGAHGKLNMMVS